MIPFVLFFPIRLFYNDSNIKFQLLQIDKNLSFLDGYIQQSIEKGAQPYIPESERLGMSSITNFRSQEDHEPSTHALRFEAYELPKPSSTELVPVPEPSYSSDIFHPPSPASNNAGPSDLKLRLDGVQKKWGRPTYSSPAPSTSTTGTTNIQNESTQRDPGSNTDPKTRATSYDTRKQKVEIPPEKQKLAASLFGGLSKPQSKQPSSSQRISKPHNHSSDTSRSAKTTAITSQPPPDLLDLGESSFTSSVPSVDPFQQFEGLFDLTQGTTSVSAGGAGATESSDFMSLFSDMSLNVQSHESAVEKLVQQPNKGPNLKEALEKDSLVRQMGVTPSGQNPNLFKNLLG